MKLGILSDVNEKDFEFAAKNKLAFIEICQNIGCDCKEFTKKAEN